MLSINTHTIVYQAINVYYKKYPLFFCALSSREWSTRGGEKNCCVVWWNGIIYFIIITYTTYNRDTSINWAWLLEPIHRWRSSTSFRLTYIRSSHMKSRTVAKSSQFSAFWVTSHCKWKRLLSAKHPIPLFLWFRFVFSASSSSSCRSLVGDGRKNEKSYSRAPHAPTKICFIVCFAIYIKNIKILYHDTAHIF